MSKTVTKIEAQPGPQQAFLSTPADFAIYGGAAFGGKTFALLMETVRHYKNPGYGAVIFRRTYPQVTNEGGLWDSSQQLYPLLGAKQRESDLSWTFPSGAKVRFSHLQYESNKLDWQGAQVPLIGWDELTHFCYRPAMETLTDRGWKRIADVRVGERVLALTPEGVGRYERVAAAWAFDYEGDLHETTNRSIRYSVTPNHKMVIRRQGYTGWQFCEAKDLDRFPLFPFDSEWIGEEQEWVDLPAPAGRGVGPNQNSVARIKADDYTCVRDSLHELGYTDHIASRRKERQAKLQIPGYRAKRWIAERTHSWTNRFRRLLVR